MKKSLVLLWIVFFLIIAGCSSDGGDETNSRKFTASGTYAYSDGTLSMNWTNSDFLCNGPVEGFTNTKTNVKVTATTLAWSDYNDGDIMIWTRESGTSDDPAGTWERIDEELNTYALTITAADSASGTMSLTATISACAGNFFPADSAVCGNAACESGETDRTARTTAQKKHAQPEHAETSAAFFRCALKFTTTAAIRYGGRGPGLQTTASDGPKSEVDTTTIHAVTMEERSLTMSRLKIRTGKYSILNPMP